ncbi:MAG: rhodanese-like domain-containing protein [Zetaproteobacteria bacterium CG12_big_fil_rev_8_21_14_0_65_55_1124]|nr:MAG: hypothetical protein AUJ58_03875 [Zetaproteobacteria bacterium CG1_02_55_237]PIS20381.1 MAG: rhodanese-like domain-containing protein [Zetaproteobacteria bacterium CG08_land_8_20_14_0_20_55_17]PIW42467.1 MAG: rhodanese-like domain-containing protein [Zetaproteobacteria bacterium CG12_big_fil_rev_8_21_14_0_65_55_1124]PIY52383.1 MAG: rhodanese-like domain-containing protein [Zetaproteobacteria bacterium CG_4_10_14_0_8_um_filter_55_43]PIZ37162.1 MAG: rhodanese-like domain-containing protei
MSVNEFYPRWLVATEKGEDCIIVDVRSPGEYSKGHVPSARLLPLDSLPGAAHVIARDKPVYLICQGGMRSLQAMDYLAREHGLANLVNITGGTMAWINAGYPVKQGGHDGS